MKNHTLFIPLFTFMVLFQSAISQNLSTDFPQELTQTDSLYLIVLEHYIKEFPSKIKNNNLYIEHSTVTHRLPGQIKGVNIVKLKDSELKKTVRKSTKLHLVYVEPLSFNDGTFSITLTPKLIKNKGVKLNISTSDWITGVFVFKNNKLELDNVAISGI